MSRMYQDGRPVSGQPSQQSSPHPVAGVSNAAMTRALSVQRLQQNLPYIGALGSYLNPLNQAARLLFEDLTPDQERLLTGIFGNSLATSVIRMNYNSVVAACGDTPRTTGNVINVPGPTVDEGTLIHEAAHVWQHQNGIPFMYAVSALRSQAIAAIVTGSRDRAYKYDTLEKHHVPWRYWNAEQQASWIEDHKRLPDAWWLSAVDVNPLDGDPDIPMG